MSSVTEMFISGLVSGDTSDEVFIELVFELANEMVGEFGSDLVSTDEREYLGGAFAVFGPETEDSKIGLIGTLEYDLTESHISLVDTAIRSMQSKQSVVVSHCDTFVSGVSVGMAGIKLNNDWYMAFAGFPPEWSQVFCMLVGDLCGLLKSRRGNSIIEKSCDSTQIRVKLNEARARLLFDVFSSALGKSRD